MIVVAGCVIASEETRAEMLRIGLEHTHRSRKEEGCIEHGIYVDAENPSQISILRKSFNPSHEC